MTNALEDFFGVAENMQDYNEILFYVLGDGELKEFYKKKFTHLRNLKFIDPVQKSEVLGVISEFDLLYFSTLRSNVWNFGQSLNKLIDYMLSGKPILGSFDGYPSMINEANCGKFVSVGDKELLKEKILEFKNMSEKSRNLFGRRAIDWITRHRSFKTLAINYEKILKKTLEG